MRSGKTAWHRYLEENVYPTGRHKKIERWYVTGIWEFTREDGVRTHHKADTPCPFWSSAVEWSMEMLDAGKICERCGGDLKPGDPDGVLCECSTSDR